MKDKYNYGKYQSTASFGFKQKKTSKNYARKDGSKLKKFKNSISILLSSFCVGALSFGIIPNNNIDKLPLNSPPLNSPVAKSKIQSQTQTNEISFLESAKALFATNYLKSKSSFNEKEEKKFEKFEGLVSFLSEEINKYSPEESSKTLARDIVKISLAEHADPIYVASMIASESSFRLEAKSHVGAKGLMQLMPNTAKFVAKKLELPENNLKLNDPKLNILLGVNYILQLEKDYKGNRHKALAAYNWGPGNVRKASIAGKRYPRSVNAYAKKILDRTNKWNKKFRKAKKIS